jgi:hypothetical protein
MNVQVFMICKPWEDHLLQIVMNVHVTYCTISPVVIVRRQRSELWTNGSELWTNGSELWHNDINIDITKRRYELTIFNIWHNGKNIVIT